ncbi:MAG: hypothetical protein ACXWH1_14875 [Thermoanaerobaculia bacterium]
MTTFSPEAQQLFDRYLHTVRWSVRGVADAGEIERDVREHVTSALEQQEEPVSSQTLRDILSRLGDPWQWVSPEDLPIWRRVLMRFSLGPEDWRLAYASFALTLLGFILMPLGVGIFVLLGAFCLARATYELASDREDSLGPRRWLVYPPLAFFSILIVMMLMVGAAGPVLGWGVGEHGFELLAGVRYAQSQPVERALFYTAAVAVTIGSWWILLSGIVAIAIRPMRWLLVPFANRLRRVHALWLTIGGAVVAGAGTSALLFLQR